MGDSNLPDAEAAPLTLEIQLGIEQRRSREQRRRVLEHPAAHQLEATIDIARADAVEEADQQVEHTRDDQAITGVGTASPPPGRQVGVRHQAGDRGQVGRIELAVAVHEGHVVAAGRPQAIGHGDSIAAPAVMANHAETLRLSAHGGARHRGRVVGAAIVDQDDLPVVRQRGQRFHTAAHHACHVRRLVVSG